MSKNEMAGGGRWRTFPFLWVALALATTASAQPNFSKVFVPDTIGPGSVSTLTFTITNDGGAPLSDLAFTDVLPAGVTIASPASAGSDCLGVSGTLTAPNGGGTVTLVSGQLAPSSACTVSVDVTSSTPGTHVNVSGVLTSSAGNSGTATDDLMVVTTLPGFSKSFAPASLPIGARSTLTFTIDNTANASGVQNLDFTDALPTGMEVADPANASSTCGSEGLPPTVVAVPGSSTITLDANGGAFSGFWALAAGAACTVSVDVVATGSGMLGNVSGDLLASFVSSGKANAILDVTVTPLSLVKSFVGDPIQAGGTAQLEFAITNRNRRDSASNIAFTDDLEATLTGLVATGLPLSVCGGTLDSADAGQTISFTGGDLGPEGSCTFSVTLQVPAGATAGVYPNTTSTITADVGGSPEVGNPATDTLFLSDAPTLTKDFLDDPVGAGSTTTLEFTVTNVSSTSTATDITFVDELTTFLPFPLSATLPTDPCGAGSAMGFIYPNTDRQAVQLTGGTLAPGASCTFTVDIDIPLGLADGVYVNTTGEITATVDAETQIGRAATDTLTVAGAPRFVKAFTDDPVLPGGTVTLEFTLEHSEFAAADATAIAFTDDLNAALAGLAAVGLPQNDVCGTGSSISGTTSLSFTGGTLAPGASCTFSVTLQVPAGAAAGSYTNTTSSLAASSSGVVVTGNPASDILQVWGLYFTKEFTDDPVEPGDPVTLRFTLDNQDPSNDATGLSFTDTLSAAVSGLVSLSGTLNDVCGAGSQISGTSSLSFTGGTLAPSASCSFDLTLQVPVATADGTYTNLTSSLVGTIGGVRAVLPPATDGLTVQAVLPPLFTKVFAPSTIAPGGVSTLTFTIDNTAEATDATALDFTDNLPAGVTVAATPNASTTCTGGTLTANAGTGTITYTGGTVAGGATCTVTVDVTSSTVGAHVNTSGALTSSAGNSGSATATLNVGAISLGKSFTDDPVVAGRSVTLQFTITNSNVAPADNITFTDDLGAVVPGLVATGLPAADVCGAGSQISGTGVLTFTGGLLGPGASCTFSVTLQVPLATAAGSYPNTTSAVAARVSGFTLNGSPATDSLIVQAAPDLSINDVSAAEGDSGTTDFNFTVSLSAPAPDEVTVDFATADGTAAQGLDYNTASGSLTFAAGETTKSVIVQVIGELLFEPDETFFVDLTSPSGALLADGQGQGTILNDEVVPSLSIDDVTLPEGDTGTTAFDFTVTLSAPSTDAISVDYATADGTALSGGDYAATSGTLNLAPGETTGTITVQVVGDLVAEATEDFFVNLSSPANVTIGDGQGLGTILRDERLGRDDFDGDGRTDILWRNDRTHVPMLWFMNGASVEAEAPFAAASAQWEVIGVGDFNGDARADILWREKDTGRTYVWLMDGATKLPGTGFTSRQGAGIWGIEALGDFDGNGNTDILWRHKGSQPPLGGTVYLWLMDGSQVVGAGEVGKGSVTLWDVAGASDFDGDRDDDVLWREKATGKTYLWFMEGLAAYGGAWTAVHKDTSWTVEGLGDLNKDSMGDVVWRNTLTGEPYVWLMDGADVPSEGSLGPAALKWRLVGVGDFDGDLRADLLWRELITRKIYLWFMDGLTVIDGAFTDLQLGADWNIENPE